VTALQGAALRALIHDVCNHEIELARRRRDVALLRAGLHPQQHAIEGVLAWAEAVREGCRGR